MIPWAAAGCNDTELDRDPSPSDRDSITNTAQSPVLTVTDLVQRWVTEPASNYGVLLVGSGTQSGVYAFGSSEWGNVASRPKLQVIYTIPTATPTPSMTPTPTASFTPTSTGTPTATATVTATGDSTATPSATPTGPTPTPTITETPGGDTATPTATSTATTGGTATDTPTPTATYDPAIYGTVAGVVWYDGNGNGIREPEEDTLIGVQITLEDEFGEPIRTRVTTQGGMYVFLDVPAGNYVVQETNMVGYVSTTPDEMPATVVAGATEVIDFGDRLPARLYLPLVVKAAQGAGGGAL